MKVTARIPQTHHSQCEYKDKVSADKDKAATSGVSPQKHGSPVTRVEKG